MLNCILESHAVACGSIATSPEFIIKSSPVVIPKSSSINVLAQ